MPSRGKGVRMPGQQWQRPGDGHVGGGESKPPPPARPAGVRVRDERPDWQRPTPKGPKRISASEVEERTLDLEISLGLDKATRLSGASGGSPADAQSPPLSSHDLNGLCFVIGRRVMSLGSMWTMASVVAITLVVVIALCLLVAHQSWLAFVFGVGAFYGIGAFLAAHTHRGS